MKLYKADNYYIEITSECNLRCIHCYNDSGIRRFLLMPNVIERIIGKEVETENISVTLSGGEPLKHPFLFDFLDLLKSKKIRTRIITNATLIDSSLAEKLSEYDIEVQVSINGTEGYIHDKICGKGNFERTIKGLRHLLDVGLADRIIGKTVLNSFNKNDLLNIIFMFINFGIHKIDIGTLEKMGRTVSNYEKICISPEAADEVLKTVYQNADIVRLIDEKKLNLKLPKLTFGCPILDNVQETVFLGPRIAANGDVFICQIFSDPEYSIGNINESTMEEILESNRLKNLIGDLREGQRNIKSCEKCVWKTSCSRGCIGMAIQNGGVSETDGQCSLRKKIFMKELEAFVS